MEEPKFPSELDSSYLEFFVEDQISDVYLDSIDNDPVKTVKMKAQDNINSQGPILELEALTKECIYSEIQNLTSTVNIPNRLRNTSNYFPFVHSLNTHILRDEILQANKNASDQLTNFQAQADHFEDTHSPPLTSILSNLNANHTSSSTKKREPKHLKKKAILQEKDLTFGHRYSSLAALDNKNQTRPLLPTVSKFLND